MKGTMSKSKTYKMQGTRSPAGQVPISRAAAAYALMEEAKRLLGPEGTERVCVNCGCTDSRACAGGCAWAEVHKATPTGVCTRCVFEKITLGQCVILKPGPSAGTVWIQDAEGEGMETPEAHLEQAIKEYFRKNF